MSVRIAAYLPEKVVHEWDSTPMCIMRDLSGKLSFRMNLNGTKLLVWKDGQERWLMKRKHRFGKAEAMEITEEQVRRLLFFNDRILPCIAAHAEDLSVSVEKE